MMNPTEDVSYLLFERENPSVLDNCYDGINQCLTVDPYEYIGPIRISNDNDKNNKNNTNTTGKTTTTTSTTNNTGTKSCTSSKKGRSLRVTRDVKAGELLFITSPVLKANVHTIRKRWIQRCVQRQHQEQQIKNNDTTSTVAATQQTQQNVLNEIAEEVLVETCQNCIDPEILSSCTGLMGGSCSNVNDISLNRFCKNKNEQNQKLDNNINSINNDRNNIINDSCIDTTSLLSDTTGCGNNISSDDWIQIIRRNAFGPDFITSNYITKRWLQDYYKSSNVNDTDTDDHDVLTSTWFIPLRILSLYPLAALINHSCIPNVSRVYVCNTQKDTEYMIVHACRDIKAFEELYWSYIPVIDPYITRYKSLQQSTHGFICYCTRCTMESKIWKTNEYIRKLSKRCTELINSTSSVQTKTNHNNSNNHPENEMNRYNEIRELVHTLENDLLSSSSSSSLSNEEKRYIQVSFLSLYLLYINQTLIQCQYVSKEEGLERKKELLTLCSNLHFALASCHNASTEHLSILHLCYELVSVLYSSAKNDEDEKKNTTIQLRLWTDQLKRAVQIRYGNLGNDINTVKSVMQHSKIVLRNQHGMDQVQYKFI